MKKDGWEKDPDTRWWRGRIEYRRRQITPFPVVMGAILSSAMVTSTSVVIMAIVMFIHMFIPVIAVG